MASLDGPRSGSDVAVTGSPVAATRPTMRTARSASSMACRASWWARSFRCAAKRTPPSAVTVATMVIAYAPVSRARILAMRRNLPLHHIAHTPHRRDQPPVVLDVDLLAQVVDHDVHDVGAGIEVVPPRILGDQGPAHDFAGVPHEVLQHRVFFWREFDRCAVAPHFPGVLVEHQVTDADRRRDERARAA